MQRTIGASILVVLTLQAALLALMLSGSGYLQAISVSGTTAWGLEGFLMLLIGIIYLIMAYGVWSPVRWTYASSVVILIALIGAAVLNSLYTETSLAFGLVIFMCFSINFAIISWFFWSRNKG